MLFSILMAVVGLAALMHVSINIFLSYKQEEAIKDGTYNMERYFLLALSNGILGHMLPYYTMVVVLVWFGIGN